MIGVDALRVRAGSFELRDVRAEVPHGTWTVVLGPPGSGKTTLLETIAGVRRVASGRVLMRDVDVTHLPPERRGIALVHQRGFLFPHLSVSANIQYGARDNAYASAMAARFGADALRDRPVSSLSGGETQVVALARALATRPDILLLDEPFAALDPRGRMKLRRELQALQREQAITIMQVTHDFAEAGMLGDQALLLDDGRLVQSGTPANVFRRPGTARAAEFLGAENVIAGVVSESARADGVPVSVFDAGAFRLKVAGTHASGAGHAIIRGEDVGLSRDPVQAMNDRTVLDGKVVEVTRTGVISRVTVDVNGLMLDAIITADRAEELRAASGTRLFVILPATAIHLC